jgi:hypothetical protein
MTTTTNANNNNRQQQQPYNNQTTTTLQGQEDDDTKQYDKDRTTNMSEDEQRPAAATFEEAFRDVQPRPDLEATLMARYPELQVEAERVRRARQEEEQAYFSRGIPHVRTSGDGDGTITFRRPGPNEHRLSEGNLSRIERERYAEDLGRIIDAKDLEEDDEELKEDDTDDDEDSNDRFDRELTKWERRMELDTGRSNPFEHYIDIPFLLGLYLSCGCSFTQS